MSKVKFIIEKVLGINGKAALLLKIMALYGDIREINGIHKGAKAVKNKEKEIRL